MLAVGAALTQVVTGGETNPHLALAGKPLAAHELRGLTRGAPRAFGGSQRWQTSTSKRWLASHGFAAKVQGRPLRRLQPPLQKEPRELHPREVRIRPVAGRESH